MGEEAFSKARSEGKMIFLSIGYSTCHWCHVMAHESFENERIAKVMNDHFISIKVDREERPDVDAIYMNFVQASTGHGGWPMSVWLTPELKPVVGGTYFPPESRKGQPGFADVCLQVSQAWKENPEQLMQSSQRILEYLREASHVTPAREAFPVSVTPMPCGRGWIDFQNSLMTFSRVLDPLQNFQDLRF